MIPGGARKITAENMALRQELISLTRHRKRAHRLSIYERITFGLHNCQYAQNLNKYWPAFLESCRNLGISHRQAGFGI